MSIFRKISQLFKRKPAEFTYEIFAEDDGPLFEVGERVLIINPNLIDPPDEPPEIRVIHSIVYLPEIDEYVYQLEGSPMWYNENWLQADLYGPMYYSVRQVNKIEKIDNLLDIYEWNKRMYARTGDESYAEKIKMIEDMLKELTVEK